MQAFPIAGIGASAGGLDAIKTLLVNLRVDTGLALVIVQHLASNQESMLPEILTRLTKMPVKKVEDGMLVEPNNVYVIPSGATMTIDNNTLRLHPKMASLKPIDEFLVSLAVERKTRAIGIILSGTGTDGTEGLSAIKAEGGITFAQEPKSAQYPDMPKSAISAETVYFVLTPEQIAEELSSIAKHPELSRKKMGESKLPEGEEQDPQVIFTILKAAFGVNFSNYKKTTVNRRISRRMILNKIENMKEYTMHLRAHPEEQQALFEDLLISVTTFFREPNTFLILKENVFSQLIEKRQSNRQPIRVWIPGCSTGEEVYSIAIAIVEFLEEKHLVNIPTQIFGTDVNVKNIDKARRGIFSNTIEDNVSKDRINRFFTRLNGNSQVIKPIRDMCIFAKHDLTQDPPFSKIDLIVCRNLLIYMESPMQERIISIFNYALKPNGYLVLGESESVGKFSTMFDSITKRGVVFRKKSGQLQDELPLQVPSDHFEEKMSLSLPRKNAAITKLKEEVDELLMSSFVPATLLVNSNSDVLVFRGQVNPYVSIEPGNASFNVTKLVRKELRPTVQTAIFRAKKSRKEICETVRYEEHEQTHIVSVQVRPFQLAKQEEPFFLILFEEKAPAEKQTKTSKHTTNESDLAKDQQIKELSEDLDSTKQTLQTVIEQQEASNEELRSANEEVQSSNEELMSTNEELETSKEELQSANEELTTLNDELKNRNQTLSHLNDDLANLMDNIDTAVVIIDTHLKIKRFTASAQELLRIMPSDVEHPITDVRLAIHVEDLEKLLMKSIRKLSTVRMEINDRNHWYQMRIRPYITGDKKIFGAVLSFSDITELKKWENEKKRHTQNLEKLVQKQAEKIVQSETLATIGKTAGMVGHDIRNPLQAIVSELYLAKTEVEELSDSASKKNLKESMASIEEQTFYINKIVSDLQDIARKSAPQLTEVNIEKIVREILTSMPANPNIEAYFHIEKDFPKLVLDNTYLRRILTNLISNAIQAMPTGGKITVSASVQKDNALINVEDTGEGMSKEVKNKIFTPLFTTKAKGQGFGLPVVKKLTEAMDGTVSFESEKGNGTKFTLKFPVPKKSQS